MAYVNSDPTGGDDRNHSKSHPQWSNINLVPPSDKIRILLFKECRFRDRQLIFDSNLNRNEEKKGSSTKYEKKNADEFAHLTELIFGSTAMKYQDTYYKIHDVSSPDRLIFTQVFSTPTVRKIRENSYPNCCPSFGMSSNIIDCDSSSNSLSQTSLDSRSESFSIFRKNNWAPSNSTSTTIDSGFSESSFSSKSSFQPSYGSFTRRGLDHSNTSLNICNSFHSSRRLSQNLNYSKLGLALIVPVASNKKEQQNVYIQHIIFIESILWRIRYYMELALKSPKQLFATMYEISSISIQWLSKELSFWTKRHSGEAGADGIQGNTFRQKLSRLNLRKLLSFKQDTKDEQFESFCRTLNEFDTKETKFFLSALLTAILTHHTGWIGTCYRLEEMTLNESYHAIWRQLTNLCGASGYLTKTSRTVIYGLKSDEVIKRVLNFLPYFIRCFNVQRKLVERDNVIEENRLVEDIFKKFTSKSHPEECLPRGMMKSKKMSTRLSDMTYLNENNNNRKSFSGKGLTKNKTFGRNLSSLNDSQEFGVEFEDEDNEKPVLFILGDDDKLQNLKRTVTRRHEELDESKEKGGNKLSTKLRVITFPLPRVRSAGDLSEVIPYDFLRDDAFGHYVPDRTFQGTRIPEKEWRNILKNDLAIKRSCLFPNQIEENVAILGNTDNWEVQVLSSTRNRMAKIGSDYALDSSPLVSNMLEVVLEMWKMNFTKEQCSTFMEQRLLEICLKANALSQFLLASEFSTIETLLSTLKLNVLDVPLLMSVGSYIDPEIIRKYGISYQ